MQIQQEEDRAFSNSSTPNAHEDWTSVIFWLFMKGIDFILFCRKPAHECTHTHKHLDLHIHTHVHTPKHHTYISHTCTHLHPHSSSAQEKLC